MRQVVEDPTKNGVLAAQPYSNKECLIGDGKVEASLGFTGKSRSHKSLTQETRVKEC